jgi:hypothetical protein
MNRDLGVWTNEDSALVLIDYQPEQFESIHPGRGRTSTCWTGRRLSRRRARSSPD